MIRERAIKLRESIVLIAWLLIISIFAASANYCTQTKPETNEFSADVWHIPQGRFVINEIDHGQHGTDTAEFIEPMNTGNVAINPNGYG